MVVEDEGVGVGRGGVVARGIDAHHLIVVAPRGQGVGESVGHRLIGVVARVVGRHLGDEHLVDIQKLAPAVDMRNVLA